MINLKTNEELNKDIKFNLILYITCMVLFFISVIASFFMGIGALVVALIFLNQGLNYDVQRNADLIRLEIRTLRVKEYE